MLKKTLFFSIAFTLSSFALAQKKYVDVTLIKTSNDTINGKMFIVTNLFNKTLLDERSFYKKVLLLDENAKKVVQKIKPQEVQKLNFEFQNHPYVYVNDGKQLQILVHDGKIKWYKRITSNFYDGSIDHIDYLKDEKGKEYQLGMYNHKMNKLKELFKDHPTILAELEGKKFNEISLYDILNQYDEMN